MMKACRQILCLLLAVTVLAGMTLPGLAQEAPGSELAQNAAAVLTKGDLKVLAAGDKGIPLAPQTAALDADSLLSPAPAAQAAPRTARSNIYSADYYGSQLTAAARAVYDAVRVSALWNGPAETSVDAAAWAAPQNLETYGTCTATMKSDGRIYIDCSFEAETPQQTLNAAGAALVYDHPELSWLVNTNLSLMSQVDAVPEAADYAALQTLQPGETYEFINHTIRYTVLALSMPAESVRMATTSPEDAPGGNPWDYADTGTRADTEAALAAAQAEIGSLSGRSAAAKVQAVHDWLCGHTEYADTQGERFKKGWRGYQTAYSALVEGVSVCAGYARAMKLLLDLYGIPCVIVRGESRGEAHAWNYVQLDGRWYGLDATWADQSWGISTSEFLKGSSAFLQDHAEADLAPGCAFSYPVLAADDYEEGAAPPVPVGTIPGDVNLDSMVNLADLAELAQLMASGNTAVLTDAQVNGDLDQSGILDLQDILLLAGALRTGGCSQGAAAAAGANVRITAAPQTVKLGDTIEVTVQGTGQAAAGKLTATGLAFVSVSSQLSDGNTFILLPDYGTPQVTYTYRVTAADGTVSVCAGEGCEVRGGHLRGSADAVWSVPVQAAPSSASPAPDPGTDPLPEAAAELVGCNFVYADAYTGVWVRVTDSRITQLSGRLTLSGFDRKEASMQMELEETGWKGGSADFKVTASPGQSVSAKLTDITAVVDGRRASLPDLSYTAPVRRYNLPAGYLAASGPERVSPGETFDLKIAGRGPGLSADLLTQGFEILSVSSTYCGPHGIVLLPDYDLPDVTYTCRVTAAPGETASVNLTNVQIAAEDGAGHSMVVCAPDVSWKISVSAAADPGPEPLPAPEIPALDGYQGGTVKNTVYYAKTSGAAGMYYVKNRLGKIVRVAVPSVESADDTLYYPINHASRILYPRLEGGRVTAYCEYKDGMEIPVLRVSAEAAADRADGYQVLQVGGVTYYVRTRGANAMYYVKNRLGKMVRVAVPQIRDAGGNAYYPVNHGGSVLVPTVDSGGSVSYGLQNKGETAAVLQCV